MLHVKESSAYGDKCVQISFTWLPRSRNYNKQLPSNLNRWRLPGSVEDEEQIWRDLEEVFRDAGVTDSESRFGQMLSYPPSGALVERTQGLSSGFGHAIPTRTDPGKMGTVGNLLQFE